LKDEIRITVIATGFSEFETKPVSPVDDDEIIDKKTDTHKSNYRDDDLDIPPFLRNRFK